MDVNVWSTVAVTRALLKLMPSGSVIINMSSQAARNGGGPGAVLYAGSKGAVLAITRGWAKELADRNIRVNCVAPGFIDTDFHRRHTPAGEAEKIAEISPANKAGEVDDVARAVVYLAGEGGGFITGACIDINGGTSMA
jgi:3-oxoacyl-[acyl-carrier protein] reductase